MTTTSSDPQPRSLDDIIVDLAQAIYSRKQESICELLRELAKAAIRAFTQKGIGAGRQVLGSIKPITTLGYSTIRKKQRKPMTQRLRNYLENSRASTFRRKNAMSDEITPVPTEAAAQDDDYADSDGERTTDNDN